MYAHRYISPVPAYSPIVIFGDGSTLFFRARERPHMILDEVQQRLLLSLFIMKMIILPRQARDKRRESSKKRCVMCVSQEGHLAALATAVGNPAQAPCGVGEAGCSGGNGGIPGADHTFTLIQPIANSKHSPPPHAEQPAAAAAEGLEHGGYGGRGFHDLG